MSIRRTGRRWRPSATSRRWPSPCSAGSTPARSTTPTPSGPWPPGAWPAWASTPRPPRRGWPATARSGCSPPMPTAGGWPTSRSRASTPRWSSRARCWPAASPRPCTWAATPPRTSSRCGRPCGPTTGGWTSSWPPPRAGGPGASPSTSTTWTGPPRRSPGPATTASTGASCSRPCPCGPGCPGYADDYYEPLWSACEEHGIVVNLHTGASGSATDAKQLYDDRHGGFLGLYEVFVFTRRPLWFLIFGGVFDRHPDLRWWSPRTGCSGSPPWSGTWSPSSTPTAGPRCAPTCRCARRSTSTATCSWVGRSCSAPRPRCARRSAWTGSCGEPTTPTSRGRRRSTGWSCARCSADCPKPDLRRILGGNACRLFGFDGAQLQEVADRVGPTVADLSTADRPGRHPGDLQLEPGPSGAAGVGRRPGVLSGVTGTHDARSQRDRAPHRPAADDGRGLPRRDGVPEPRRRHVDHLRPVGAPVQPARPRARRTGGDPGGAGGHRMEADHVLHWIVAYSAVHKLGAVAVPLNNRLSPPEVRGILEHAEVDRRGGQRLLRRNGRTAGRLRPLAVRGGHGGRPGVRRRPSTSRT